MNIDALLQEKRTEILCIAARHGVREVNKCLIQSL